MTPQEKAILLRELELQNNPEAVRMEIARRMADASTEELAQGQYEEPRGLGTGQLTSMARQTPVRGDERTRHLVEIYGIEKAMMLGLISQQEGEALALQGYQ